MRTLIGVMALLALPVGVVSAQDMDDNQNDERNNMREGNQRGGGPRFADPGILTISSDAAFSIQRQSTSGVSGGTTTIQLAPAADYFVARNFSVGGFIGFDYVRAGDNDATRFSIGPRVGYNFPVGDMWSVWPRAGVSLAVTSADNDPGPAAEDTTFALNLFVPIIAHPTPHFFIGLGPFLDTDLSGDARTTVFGLRLTTGGWLDLSSDNQNDDR